MYTNGAMIGWLMEPPYDKHGRYYYIQDLHRHVFQRIPRFLLHPSNCHDIHRSYRSFLYYYPGIGQADNYLWLRVRDTLREDFHGMWNNKDSRGRLNDGKG